MDTKLPKWKVAISFAAFFMGVSLLISSLTDIVGLHMRHGSLIYEIKNAYEEDYQNTEDFKRYMGDRLETFITMAVGGPLWYDYEYGGYSDNYYNGITDVVIDAEVSQGSYEYPSSYNYGYGYGYDTPRSTDSEGAKRLNELMKKDKNILYTISYEDKELYTNTDDIKLDKTGQTLPEGYNFMLHFDGKTVQIVKDGQEIDIYGDGYYREEDKDWYVPGYKNFNAGEDAEKVEITLIVAKSPVMYMNGNYTGGSRYNDNRLYWIEYSMKESRKELAAMLTCIVAGLILVIIYILLRKSKKIADNIIAVHTAKIWYEVKLVILALSLIGVIMSTKYMWQDMYWMLMTGEFYYTKMSAELFNAALSDSGAILVLFWVCYLLINEARHTDKPWLNSITNKISRYFRTNEMKLSLQKRMVRRTLPPTLAQGLIIALAITVYAMYCLSTGEAHLALGLVLLAAIAALIAAWIMYLKNNRAVLKDIGVLTEHITSVRCGNLKQPADLSEDSDLREAVSDLNDIQEGLNQALEEQMKSERLKVELVSNVSHDVKTPLTSIISYIDLLKQEDSLPDYIRDYVNILDTKSQRLKSMVQDVFEVSKAASGQLPVNIETIDLGKLLRQTLADMDEKIRESTVSLKISIPTEPVAIRADGQRLYRVFQNLLQNALRYSLDGSRVYVELTVKGQIAIASVKNTSKVELSDKKDYAERFQRGDESRTDGGSGLGLSIAKSFTEACGGKFSIEIIADLFVCTVEFEILGETPAIDRESTD